MPHYKDTEGKFHFLDDAAYEHLLPAGCVQIPAEEAAAHQTKSLEERRAAAWEAVKRERDRRREVGGFYAAGKWFHSDLSSRTQHLALARKADRYQALVLDMHIPMTDLEGTPIYWKTMDGTFAAMTATLAHQISAATETSELNFFSTAETLGMQIRTSDDPESIVASAVWPRIYGEN